MKKIITIMLSLLVLFTMVLSGCSNGGEESKGASVENSSEKKSKELVIGYGIDIKGVNTHICCETKSYILPILYDTLVKLEDGKIKPNLAESWKINKDKTEYIFNLKKNVKFSDGTVFNSKAVKKSLIAVTKNKRYSWLPISKDLKNIEDIDEYTLKITMKKSTPDLLNNLLQHCPTGIMAPSTIKKMDPVTIEGSIGTGPYKLSDFKPNKYYTFVKNENYWGKKQVWDKVTLKIIPDSESRMLALSSGEIDAIIGSSFLTFDTINSISKNKKCSLKISDSLVDTRNIKVNSKSKVLSDVKVRKAIGYAINREEIVKSIFSGYEDVYNSWLIKDLPYCNTSLKPYSYDVKKANKLLQDAGWVKVNGSKYRQKNGKELKIEFGWITDYQTDRDLALAVKGYLEKVGINVHAYGSDLDTFTKNFLTRKYDLVLDDMTPVPYQPFVSVETLENKMGQFVDGLPMYDKLKKDIKIISSSGDDKEIKKAFKDLVTTIHDQAVTLPIATKKEPAVYNKEKISDIEFTDLPQMIIPDNIKSK